jgi:alginate O-acetyltransferase complex protein AlgJ
MLSNQLGRPVSLVWKVHQSSPYRTLLGALQGDAFRKQKPKLLVWDFQETDMVASPDEAGVWGPNVIRPDEFLAALRRAVAV